VLAFDLHLVYLVIPISDGKDSDHMVKIQITYIYVLYIYTILEVVAGGIVQTAADIHRYVKCTLLNSTKLFEDVVKSAHESLRLLCHGKFLERNEDTKLYSTSSLSPKESLVKYCTFYCTCNLGLCNC
jgi:hypothetical protein